MHTKNKRTHKSWRKSNEIVQFTTNCKKENPMKYLVYYSTFVIILTQHKDTTNNKPITIATYSRL